MINYLAKDQNWADATTTYWFDVDGEEYGIVEDDGQGSHHLTTVVDWDGCPVNMGDAKNAHLLALVVTDEIRNAD